MKSKRLPAQDFDPPRQEPNELEQLVRDLRAFIASPGMVHVNVPEFCRTVPINFDDPLLELVPEAYIESRVPVAAEIQAAVDDLARETVSFLVKFKKEDDAGAFG